jgi:hypothetical protein
MSSPGPVPVQRLVLPCPRPRETSASWKARAVEVAHGSRVRWVIVEGTAPQGMAPARGRRPRRSRPPSCPPAPYGGCASRSLDPAFGEYDRNGRREDSGNPSREPAEPADRVRNRSQPGDPPPPDRAEFLLLGEIRRAGHGQEGNGDRRFSCTVLYRASTVGTGPNGGSRRTAWTSATRIAPSGQL